MVIVLLFTYSTCAFR